MDDPNITMEEYIRLEEEKARRCDETSLSECDEEEQNVLYFNDLFPFNVIYPDDSKSDKDNDDDNIDIKQSSRGPRERNIDEYWWRIYKSEDLEVLES
ncbi:hypothetical protein Tco_1193501 [Tanacetum coccineum]